MKVVFKDFCQETTAHGFLRIGDSDRRWWARLFWTIVLLTFTAVFSWQVKLLVEKFFRYETTVNTVLTTEDLLIFPTITLCNVNPYQKSLLPQDSKIDRYLKLLENVSTMEYTGEMKEMCASNDPVVLLFCLNVTDSANTTSTTVGSQAATASKASTPVDPETRRSTTTEATTSPTTAARSSQATTQQRPPSPPPTGDLQQQPPPPPDGGLQQGPQPPPPPPEGHPVKRRQAQPIGPGPGPGGPQGQPPPPPGGPSGSGFGTQQGQFPPQNGAPPLPGGGSFGNGPGGPPPPPPDDQQHQRDMGSKVSWLMMENKAFRDIGVLAAMDKEEYEAALQPRDDFIQDCRYNMAPCAGITKDWHPWYGTCYSFNPSGNHTSIRPGPLYGLSLQLHVNKSEYLRSTYVVGVRVGIDQAYRMPFPEINGVFAPVGAATAISLEMIEMKRKGPPYGDCLMDGGNMNRTDVYYYGTNYTLNGCLNTCLQRQIVKHCNCWSFAYPEPPGNNGKVPLCASASKMMCATNQEMSMNDNCTCWPMCNDVVYKTSTSHSVWPLQEQPCPPGPMCSSDDGGASEYASRNQLKLQLYFESLTKFTYTESEAYAVLSLISDFGGQLGLWIGASFCTMIELISFGLSLFTACCGCSHHNVEKRRPAGLGTKATNSYGMDAPNGLSRSRSMSVPPPQYVVYPKASEHYYG